MTLKEFEGLLKTACPNVVHFKPRGKGFPRIVYAETERIYESYDNKPAYRGYKVDVYLFTKTAFDPVFDKVEDALIENDISFSPPAIGYGGIAGDAVNPLEDGVICYLFECEVWDG